MKTISETGIELSAAVLEAIPAYIFVYDLERNRTVFINQHISDLIGYSLEEVAAMGSGLFAQVAHPDEVPRLYASLERLAAMPQGKSQLLGYRVKDRDGTWRRLVTWATPLARKSPEQASTILVVAFDAEVQKRAMSATLNENEAKYQAIFHRAPLLMAIASLDDGRCLAINDRFIEVTGYSREEVIGKTLIEMGWLTSTGRAPIEDLFRETGRMERIEVDWQAPDGRTLSFLASGEVFTIESRPLVLFFAQDVTSEKAARQERQITIELLRMINSAGDHDDLLRSVLRFLQRQFDCEAVGIRLRQGNDYPYFETSGFDDDFVRAESRLCAIEDNGELILDASGNPLLECMCGNVLTERTDPNQPFFTARGSFWSNSTSALLAGTTEAERQSRTRNRCNGEGYESVALIPLRSGGKTFGLIQFNDRRKNRFTAQSIALLEDLADHLATYLAKCEAENAHRASEEKYRQLFEMESDALFMVDSTDGRIIEANLAAERLYGYTRDEFLSMKNTDLSAQPDETRKAMIEHQEKVPLRYYYRKDGTIFAGEITARHHVWQGKPVMICAVRDISERLRSEEALADRERMFATLIANLPGFVYRCQNDRDWTMVYISDGCLAVTGYRPDELIDNRSIAFNDIIRPDYRSALWDKWQETLDRRGVFEEEYPIITKTGEARWVWERGRGIFDENGNLRFLEGFITDVTERKHADELLRASEARLREAEKNAHIGNWEWTRATGELYCSEEVYRIAGLPRNQSLTIASLRDTLDHNTLATIRSEVYKSIREKRNLGIDIYVRRPDGSRRAVYVQGFLQVDQTGHVQGIVGTIQDVTDRKAVEEVLRDREQKLTEQNALLEQKTAALRELIEQFKSGKNEVERQVGAKINEIVFPLIHRAKENLTPSAMKAVINTLENSLHDIARSLDVGIGEKISSLSRREKEISYLVREGMSSKEIAETLGISYRSVTTHRRNIRKKLGLVAKKVDLGAHLSRGK